MPFIKRGPFGNKLIGGGANGPLDPLNLPNLELYLNSGITFLGVPNGTSVATWDDLSDFGRDATQGVVASRPSIVSPGSPTGLPLVGFTRGDISPPGTFLGGLIPIWPTDVRGYTVYAWGVYRQGAPSFNNANIFSALGDTTGFQQGFTLGTGLGIPLLNNKWFTRTGSVSEGTVTSGFHVNDLFINPTSTTACWVYRPPTSAGNPVGSPTGGDIEHYRDGVQVDFTNSPNKWRTNRVILANYAVAAADGTGSFCPDMDLGAYALFSDNHTENTVKRVTAFLRRQFEGI